ncbi:hypothetical protein ABPG72_009496 [Tetrahymena utriculariae]
MFSEFSQLNLWHYQNLFGIESIKRIKINIFCTQHCQIIKFLLFYKFYQNFEIIFVDLLGFIFQLLQYSKKKVFLSQMSGCQLIRLYLPKIQISGSEQFYFFTYKTTTNLKFKIIKINRFIQKLDSSKIQSRKLYIKLQQSFNQKLRSIFLPLQHQKKFYNIKKILLQKYSRLMSHKSIYFSYYALNHQSAFIFCHISQCILTILKRFPSKQQYDFGYKYYVFRVYFDQYECLREVKYDIIHSLLQLAGQMRNQAKALQFYNQILCN